MTLSYHAAVFVHVLSAVVWLGGMIALALLAPILRGAVDEAARQRLFHRLGRRFRRVGWICLAALGASGLVQLHARGWWGMAFWSAPGLWSSPLGHALAGKLLTVGIMLAVQAVHDFWLGPMAGRVPAGTEEARRLRKRAMLLARFNAVAALALLWFAVAVARGG
jgi:putative copper export protein